MSHQFIKKKRSLIKNEQYQVRTWDTNLNSYSFVMGIDTIH